jgi:hypothetical protein
MAMLRHIPRHPRKIGTNALLQQLERAGYELRVPLQRADRGRGDFYRDRFRELDALCWRELFVGMTRARLQLVLVLSERAAAVLLDKMA